jgi:hypothetical protein
MSNRRIFLKSLLPIATVLTLPNTAEASQDAEDDLCQLYADGLANAMKARHGGEWSIDVNHSTACAIIAKR